MNSFKDLNINEQLIQGLAKQNITIPTDIQEKAIQSILDNKDVIGEAVTGSGKTLAYLLPAFQRIDTDSRDLHTLVLAPSHELVIQINNVIKDLAESANYPVRSVTIIGNVNIKRQIDSLKSKPHIIVGTPGRVIELIKAKKLKAHLIQTIVIDEADKLLSRDNITAINSIIKTTLKERQILAFSASIKDNIIETANEIMTDPVVFQLSEEKLNNDIEHQYIVSSRRDKINTLRKMIHAAKPTKSIVFINKNELIQDVANRLNYHKIKTVSIYGDATKKERKEALDAFKNGKATVLVASDLVARGLDLQDLSHVFNLDIPVDLHEYTHRVGRTGRAGEKGCAISIVTEKEVQFIRQISRLNGITFTQKDLAEGLVNDYSASEVTKEVKTAAKKPVQKTPQKPTKTPAKKSRPKNKSKKK